MVLPVRRYSNWLASISAEEWGTFAGICPLPESGP